MNKNPVPPAIPPRSLFLVRHGMRLDFEDPAWGKTARNPHDTPLSGAGRRQALDIAGALGGEGVCHVFSSPFLRALETAHPLAEKLGLPLRIEPGLCEWLNPEWFGAMPEWMSLPAAAARFPQVDTAYTAAVLPAFPEPVEAVHAFDRVARTLAALLERHPDGNLAVFAHGATLAQGISALVGSLGGADLRTGSIARIDLNGSAARLAHSGCGHLRESDSAVRFH